MADQTQKLYFDTVVDVPTLAKESKNKPTLAACLVPGSGWKSAVSQWGRDQLLAHRVICKQSDVRLAPLSDSFPDAETLKNINECVRQLIRGPTSMSAVATSSEHQLVQHYRPDSLGYVWAALLPFLRAEASVGNGGEPDATEQQTKRRRKAPERYGGGVPSDQVYLGSSPSEDTEPRRPVTSSSDSSFSSAGWTEPMQATLLEDASVRLASCLIRCVLNYAQPTSPTPEISIEFRDERLTYSYTLGNSSAVRAIDDGGIQMYTGLAFAQVAQLEAKKTFQKIVDGRPLITDEVLGQMVGQALCLAMQVNTTRSTKGVSRSHFVTILAVTHYLRFFVFEIPGPYLDHYKAISPGAYDNQLTQVLMVHSTHWLDVKQASHRGIIVAHLMALMNWAKEQYAQKNGN